MHRPTTPRSHPRPPDHGHPGPNPKFHHVDGHYLPPDARPGARPRRRRSRGPWRPRSCAAAACCGCGSCPVGRARWVDLPRRPAAPASRPGRRCGGMVRAGLERCAVAVRGARGRGGWRDVSNRPGRRSPGRRGAGRCPGSMPGVPAAAVGAWVAPRVRLARGASRPPSRLGPSRRAAPAFPGRGFPPGRPGRVVGVCRRRRGGEGGARGVAYGCRRFPWAVSSQVSRPRCHLPLRRASDRAPSPSPRPPSASCPSRLAPALSPGVRGVAVPGPEAPQCALLVPGVGGWYGVPCTGTRTMLSCKTAAFAQARALISLDTIPQNPWVPSRIFRVLPAVDRARRGPVRGPCARPSAVVSRPRRGGRVARRASAGWPAASVSDLGRAGMGIPGSAVSVPVSPPVPSRPSVLARGQGFAGVDVGTHRVRFSRRPGRRRPGVSRAALRSTRRVARPPPRGLFGPRVALARAPACAFACAYAEAAALMCLIFAPLAACGTRVLAHRGVPGSGFGVGRGARPARVACSMARLDRPHPCGSRRQGASRPRGRGRPRGGVVGGDVGRGRSPGPCRVGCVPRRGVGRRRPPRRFRVGVGC